MRHFCQQACDLSHLGGPKLTGHPPMVKLGAKVDGRTNLQAQCQASDELSAKNRRNCLHLFENIKSCITFARTIDRGVAQPG